MTAVAHLAAHPELPRPSCGSRSPLTRRSATARPCSISSASALACAYTLDGSDARRAAGRDASPRVEVDRHDHGRRRPSRARPTASSSTRCASRRGSSPRCRVTASRPRRPSGRDGFIHPVLADRHRRAGPDPRDPPRLRRRPARRARGAARTRPSARVVAADPRARRSSSTCDAQYRNMRGYLDAFPQVVEAAEEAMRAEGIEPIRSADPRRHRRIAAQRDGSPDAEPLHRRPRVSLSSRVGFAQ